MQKIYTLVLIALFILPLKNSFAQCTGGRYTTPVFSAYDSTMNIQYGANIKVNSQNQNLMLDVYEPSGDTETTRPLILIAHGGSFIGGTKTGTDVVTLCRDFAKMGYVVASVEYRLGIANFPFPGPDSTDASEAVMRATQDARAAVRFF
jgi:para-nitrobenzyl esterase